jgi:DNA modification methylase
MNKAEILVGSALKGLQQLPDGGVRTCITSPPYWGLRDYGTGEWVGGDQDCSHRRESKKSDKTITGHKNFTEMLGVGDAIYKSNCPRCGAVREDEQLGLEATPQEFVENLCKIFDEVRRVLTDDGTVWVNLGDTYADKSLAGVPWLFAFAMKERGWYLRQDIIWAKPNPMPESVTDRCTKSHEYIFLFSKQPNYYFDHEAIKEPLAESSIGRLKQDIDNQVGSERANAGGETNGNMKAVASKVKKADLMRGGFGRNGTPGRSDHQGPKDDNEMVLGGRNKRSVWTIGVASYKEAHFAVYPPALIEPCIKAGSADGDTVLDPFSGSGTTGEVALKLGRNYVGCELNPDYASLSERRITQALGMFAQVEVKHSDR